MATLCIRATDCLAGRASFGAYRAAPALTPRSPIQQQSQHESRTLATASPPPDVTMNSRSARGRANGQRRRRRSPPAAGAGDSSPPNKRVMDNVVILRRGQSLASLTATASDAVPSVVQAVPEKAETTLAWKDADAGVAAAARHGEREKVDELSVAAAKPSSEEAEKCVAVTAVVDQRCAHGEAAETAVAADNIGTETEEEEPVVATKQSGAEMTEEDEPEAATGQSGAQVETAELVVAVRQSGAQAETAEPAAAEDKRGPDTHEKKAEVAEYRGADAMKAEPAPPAHQTLPLAKEEAEQAYSGASFAAVAPDPRALPIPVLLLKTRGRAARFRVFGPDNDRAPAPTAAAA